MSAKKPCSNPGCSNPGVHLCSGCGEELYCTKECQKAHWAVHKLACKTAVKPEATAFLKSFDSLSSKQLKNVITAKAQTMDPKPKHTLLTKLDKIAEKPDLVKLARDHVAMADVEALLSGAGGTTAKVSSSGAALGGRGSRSGRGGQRMVMQENPNGTPSPDQLRQQAAMMRKNPDMVRKANPAFAKMTNQQIFEYANHMEQTASDPNMMKEVLKMSKLSESDRNDLQSLQEGLSGIKPVDDAWIASTIRMLKKKPDLFKSLFKGKGQLFGGVSDEQIDSFIDGACKLDKYWLNLIIRALRFLVSLYKPTTELYQTVDSYTFGMARYLVIALVMAIVFYFTKLSWAVAKFVFAKLSIVFTTIWAAVSGGPAADATLSASAGGGSYAVEAGTNGVKAVADAAVKGAENMVASAASAVAGVATGISSSGSAQQGGGSAARAHVESVDDEFEF